MNCFTKDVRLLAVLQVLADERNLTRAARRLKMSQPAISHSLAKLRRELADPLFVRGAAGLIATEKCERMLQRLPAVLAQIESFCATSESEDEPMDRGYVLGATPYAELRVLPALHRACEGPSRTVALETRILTEDFAWKELQQGRIDIAVAAVAPTLPSALRCKVIARDPYVVAARKDHPFFRSRDAAHAYLEAEHLKIAVLGGAESPVDDWLRKKRLKARKIRMTTGNFLAAPLLLEQSDLLLTVPRALAQHYSRSHLLRFTEAPFRFPRLELKMIWHPRTHHDAFHQRMRSWIAAAGQEELQGVGRVGIPIGNPSSSP